ncbi:MAG TPA: SHOCT domain-containing protein [Thermoplasmata archaeon]|nr:SHOCT domain-containing protein [Thermoplasmata archaeon]
MASMQADRDVYRHRRFIGWGIAALLLLIGIAIVVGVVVRAIVGPATGFGYSPFFFFFPFGFFIFIFFLFFAFRVFFRPWGWGGWGWGGYPMYGRSHDGAAEILRRRYASGEITKDQFDQMMRDIQQSRSPPS